MDAILMRIRGITRTFFSKCPEDHISFADFFSWDSMELLDFEIKLEDEFEVNLQEGDIQESHCILDFARLVKGEMNRRV